MVKALAEASVKIECCSENICYLRSAWRTFSHVINTINIGTGFNKSGTAGESNEADLKAKKRIRRGCLAREPRGCAGAWQACLGRLLLLLLRGSGRRGSRCANSSPSALCRACSSRGPRSCRRCLAGSRWPSRRRPERCSAPSHRGEPRIAAS